MLREYQTTLLNLEVQAGKVAQTKPLVNAESEIIVKKFQFLVFFQFQFAILFEYMQSLNNVCCMCMCYTLGKALNLDNISTFCPTSIAEKLYRTVHKTLFFTNYNWLGL